MRILRQMTLLLLASCGLMIDRGQEDLPTLLLSAPPDHVGIGKLYGSFHCGAYLEVAIALQALPEKERLDELRAWSHFSSNISQLHQGNDLETQLLIIFRMLFEPAEGKPFWHSDIENHKIIGDIWSYEYSANPSGAAERRARNDKDWPLDPITLVDGIPFLIQDRTMIPDSYETSEFDLRYCILNLKWNTLRYSNATQNARHDALAKLLNGRHWRQPLSPNEVKFLSDQIQDAVPAPLLIKSVVTHTNNPERLQITFMNSGMLEVKDTIGISVSGSGRPFHVVLLQEGVDGAGLNVIAESTGQQAFGDPFLVEEVSFPWPATEPKLDSRWIISVTKKMSEKVTQALNVIASKAGPTP